MFGSNCDFCKHGIYHGDRILCSIHDKECHEYNLNFNFAISTDEECKKFELDNTMKKEIKNIKKKE